MARIILLLFMCASSVLAAEPAVVPAADLAKKWKRTKSSVPPVAKVRKGLSVETAGAPAQAIEVRVDAATEQRFQNVQFAFDSDRLEGAATYAQLAEIAKAMEMAKTETFLIEGHTCDLGGDSHNLNLSQSRALAVKAYLEVQGIDAARLQIIGFGPQDPLVANTSETARQQNRRVQIFRKLLGAAPAAGHKGLTNSLGMKFVALPGTQVLMGVHETRNADYAAYAAAQSGVDEKWKEEAGSGKEQHPVVNVSYEDAEGFCRWLSAKEGKTYRLPTDAEWSAAVGLPNEKGQTPEEKDENNPQHVFPWGTEYPAKPGDGNYHASVVDDGYDGSAPVMSFRANELGIHDLGGNVWEWCLDWWDHSQKERVLRGASWLSPNSHNLRSSFRGRAQTQDRDQGRGFRCVLVGNDGGTGPQGPPGEVTNAQLSSAIGGTSSNSNAVSTLDTPFTNDPPTLADLELMRAKVNELIAALRR